MSSPDYIPRTHILSYVTSAADAPTNVRRLAAAATAWTSWAYLLLLLLCFVALYGDFLHGSYYAYNVWPRFLSDLYNRTAAYNPLPVAALSATILALASACMKWRSARPLCFVLIVPAGFAVVFLLAMLVIGLDGRSDWEFPYFSDWLHCILEVIHYVLHPNLYEAFAFASAFFLFCSTRFTARPIRGGRPWAALFAFTAFLPATLFTLSLSALTAALPVAVILGLFPVSYPAPLALLWLLPAALAAFLTLLLTDILRFLLWITRTPLSEKPTTHFLPTRTALTAPPPQPPTLP